MLLSEVRSACRRVTEKARHVRCRTDRLDAWAASLRLDPAWSPTLERGYHYLDHGDATLAFIVTLDAVNFGSGYFPSLVKRSGLAGYFAIAAALTERFERRGPFSAAELAEIHAGDCARLFGQEGAPPEIGELMERFAASWRELGRFLLERFEGYFVALVESAGHSAENLVGILAQTSSFNDVAEYGGRRVPFYKRAQLLATDLALAFSYDGPGRFHDLEKLTIFADNQVPLVLRADGLLEYEDSLARRIDAGDEIEAGSEEEVEIRAAAVHVCELLTERLASAPARLSAWQLDQYLWHKGLEGAYAEARPHRTRTIFY